MLQRFIGHYVICVLIQPPPSPSKVQKSASSASMNVTSSPPGSASQHTGTDVSMSPTPDTIPADSLDLFRQECIDVLSGLPGRKVQLAKFPEAYYKVKGQMFTLARYKAKKIVLLAQGIPDTVRVRILPILINTVVCTPTHTERWWCNGQHCCLPSSRSGFDSRPTHIFFFFFSTCTSS